MKFRDFVQMKYQAVMAERSFNDEPFDEFFAFLDANAHWLVPEYMMIVVSPN